MISSRDFKLPGGGTDWDAYNRAMIAAGERCSQCSGFIVFADGMPTLCGECKPLRDDDGEVIHSGLIRCPFCCATSSPHDYDMHEGGLYEEDDHEVECHACERKFMVVTHVSYTFTSPEIVKQEQESEES